MYISIGLFNHSTDADSNASTKKYHIYAYFSCMMLSYRLRYYLLSAFR